MARRNRPAPRRPPVLQTDVGVGEGSCGRTGRRRSGRKIRPRSGEAGMRLLIGTPWRATPERVEAYNYMKQWWERVVEALPSDWVADYVDVDGSASQPFNLNVCRNGIADH